MSFDPTFEEQQTLADTYAQAPSRMSARETAVGLALGMLLLAAVAGLWADAGVRPFATMPALLSALVLVLASCVSFDTPFGFTGLSQLAFVPLLFAMPAPLVPLVVAGALIAARVPEVLRGELAPARLLQTPANAWFSVGPAAVFALSGTAPASASGGLLLAALAAEFLADFTISCVRFRLARGASLAMQLRETWVYLFDAALSGVGLVLARHVRTEPAAVLALVPLLGLFALLARERHQRLQSLLELGAAYRGTAEVLGDVIEADDGYTGEHCKSVVALALEVGESLGVTGARLRNLEFAALLHDVGKIAIPKEIINKPGALDEREWELVKTHTVEGQRMLERVGGFMSEVGAVVRSHHERWDGRGYPDRLAGAEIPLEARIITCCDSWNAMRTDRVYRRALAHEVALAELQSCAGSHFDPKVVAALLPIVARESEGTAQGAPLAPPRSQLLERTEVASA